MKRLYINHKSGWDGVINKDFLDTKELFVKDVENATVLPLRVYYDKWDTFYEGGVVDENFNFLAGLERGKKGSKYSISCTRSYVLGEQERERVNESVIFGGILCAHFGHFIIESLARIWYVLQNPKDTRRIAFLLMPFGGNEPKPWFSDFFRLLKLDEKRVFFVKKPTQFLHLTLRMRTHLAFLQQGIRLYL